MDAQLQSRKPQIKTHGVFKLGCSHVTSSVITVLYFIRGDKLQSTNTLLLFLLFTLLKQAFSLKHLSI